MYVYLCVYIYVYICLCHVATWTFWGRRAFESACVPKAGESESQLRSELQRAEERLVTWAAKDWTVLGNMFVFLFLWAVFREGYQNMYFCWASKNRQEEGTG